MSDFLNRITTHPGSLHDDRRALRRRRSRSRTRSVASGLSRSRCAMSPVHIIGVPLDLGGGRRGVDMGPSAVRIAGIGERLAALGHHVRDKGDIVTPNPETKDEGDPQQEVHRRDRRGLPGALRDVAGRARRRRPAARARRRSQPRRRIGRRDRRARAPARQADRPDLGRCARRHEHARDHAQRQRPRHAARGAARPRARRALAHRRLLAEGAARAHRADRHPQSRRTREGGRSATPASTSSR